PHEASPASIPQRHVAGDSFPQRHVAGDSFPQRHVAGDSLSLGKAPTCRQGKELLL
ncbi:hypothetical protein Tco_0667659, partial [Tanacetum coccineum]